MAPSTTTLTPATDATTAVDLFDLDVTVIAEVGAERMQAGCGTSDGCGSTCTSACTSAV